MYAKVQKIITYAIILTILFDYFTANVYLLIFFFTKETHGNPINKKFHVNDRLLLGDGLFRETNQVLFGLHHSKKRMTLRIVFASVTLLKSVKYGEVYKSKN